MLIPWPFNFVVESFQHLILTTNSTSLFEPNVKVVCSAEKSNRIDIVAFKGKWRPTFSNTSKQYKSVISRKMCQLNMLTFWPVCLLQSYEVVYWHFNHLWYTWIKTLAHSKSMNCHIPNSMNCWISTAKSERDHHNLRSNFCLHQ